MLSNASTRAVPVKLDGEIRERIARLAKVRSHSTHALMRTAVYEYVEREEKRESFHQEAMAAWEEYKETGLHVTPGELNTRPPPPYATGNHLTFGVEEHGTIAGISAPKESRSRTTCGNGHCQSHPHVGRAPSTRSPS